MRIYLMRHGDAVPMEGDIEEDSQRPLSPLGRTQVRRVAEGFKRRAMALTSVWSSPMLRARETAAIMVEVAAGGMSEVSPALAPNASPAGLLTLLHEQLKVKAEAVLCVGHHPDVTLWVSFLSGIDAAACPVFSTASIAALELEPPKRKPRFIWFHTAEQLSES